MQHSAGCSPPRSIHRLSYAKSFSLELFVEGFCMIKNPLEYCYWNRIIFQIPKDFFLIPEASTATLSGLNFLNKIILMS